MARIKFKKKCGICKKVWVVIHRREFPICTPCHMKRIFSEEQKITAKKFLFLNIDKEFYEQSRFLRNIREAYLRFEDLTDRQIEAFKETLERTKNPPSEEELAKEAEKKAAEKEKKKADSKK